VQLTPGAGSAVFGNNGTGSLNLISKKGSYPSFSSLQLASGGGEYFHGLNGEFGTAAPDNRWSEYFAYSGQNTGFVYGGSAMPPAAQIRSFTSSQVEVDREFVNNFVYHFGANSNRSLQLFYDDAQHTFVQGYGGNPFCFTTCDPEYQSTIAGISQILGGPGLTSAQIETLTGLDPFQSGVNQTLASVNRAPAEYHQPNHSVKLQFDDNISSSTFFSAKYYHVNSVVTFDFPAWEEFGGIIQQGGSTNGITADFTTQLSDKSLLKIGTDFAYLHPVYDQPDPGFGVLATEVGAGDPITASAPGAGDGLGAWEFLDFLPNGPNCPLGVGACGYLQSFFPKLPKIPQNLEQAVTNRQDWSLYVDEAYSFSSKLKVEPGLRLDAVNYRMPAPGVDPTTCTTLYVPASWKPQSSGCPIATFNVSSDETQPRILQPRFAVSYEVGPNDALRFSYGRSVEFPPLGQVDLYVPPSAYAEFSKIPSFDALGTLLTGTTQTASCGIPGYQVPCANYGDQLRWENQNTIEGVPLQPVKPELFDNYDFSYSHQFNGGLAMKLTPWYRRGYQGTASTQTPLLGPDGKPIFNSDGTPRYNPPVVTNKGKSHATGLEFLVTKDATNGFSGQFTATYINEYSNVIPLSSSEDFFPSIPVPSLLLGNLYRVGFLSPFQTSLDLNYQTKSGWRISPQFQYNIGYPNDAGLMTAAIINGVPYNILNTNFSGSINVAPNGTVQYVDPEDPGSLFSPHIAATRGTPDSTWPGGKLSHPVMTANTTIEYNLGHNHLIGLNVSNIFNSLYSGPLLNTRYQPVATGISGPLTGLHPLPFYPGLGQANYGPIVRGQNAYINSPNNIGRTYYIYFQTKM
jgi:TonB-dependent receptor-like protein